jgi:two-component system cell cycle response regulator DivK
MSATVLIVDDHRSFRSLARRLLEAEGYEVVGEATDGASALAEVNRLRPRVVLLDIQLPDMDGLSALGQLRAEPEMAAIPVVALTAFAMREDRERLLRAGFDGYLGKPIDVKAFPEQVRGYCARARQGG